MYKIQFTPIKRIHDDSKTKFYADASYIHNHIQVVIRRGAIFYTC